MPPARSGHPLPRRMWRRFARRVALALLLPLPVLEARPAVPASAAASYAVSQPPARSKKTGSGAAKKPAAKKAVVKKPAARKAAVRKTAVKKTAVKKGKAGKRASASSRARVAPPPLRFTVPTGVPALKGDMATMLTSRTRGGQWGALVMSVSRGDTLFSHGSDQAMVPASTMKLFTAALALERLGADHTFSTDVLRDGTVDANGTLTGNLVLRGDGDPGLSPRFVRGDVSAPMTALARATAATGLRRVTGDLIADASAFESRRIPEGWISRYAGARYAAPFSALSLNENVLVVAVTPTVAGRRATVALEPATTALTITGTVRTVAGRTSRITARRVGDDRVLVSGTIGVRAGPLRYDLVVADPVTFTAGAYRAALAAEGVTVDGKIVVGRTPEKAVPLTRLASPPVATLVSVMNRESVNHYAELLYRNAARGPARQGIGSAETAGTTLREFLRTRVGVAPGVVTATDGSGLSVLDRVTPRALVQLLAHAHRTPWAGAFHASLPVAGTSDLLRNRMKDTPAQGNLHAKTGTLNDVIGLSGYVTAKNGEMLAFAFLYNGTDRWHARETIDAMGPTLAAFTRD